MYVSRIKLKHIYVFFRNRVHLLEKAISDIERSFTQPCIRMESKLERVSTNHCQDHSKPLSHTTVPVSLQLVNSSTSASNTTAAATANTVPDNTSDISTPDQGPPLIRPVIRGDDGRPIAGASPGDRLTTRVLQSSPTVGGSSSVQRQQGSDGDSTTALIEVPAVCQNCVDRITTHIKDLCRRALHKTTFVPYKQPANN